MNTVSTEMVEFAKKELTSIVMRLANITEEAKAKQISNEIAEITDWNNSALMVMDGQELFNETKYDIIATKVYF